MRKATDKELEDMKPKGIKQILDDFISELPKWIIDKSVEQIKKKILSIEPGIVTQTKEMQEKDPDRWWASYHHGWGTSVRNFLRDNVCLDDKLPSGNWDDYYIQVFEIACGVRETKNDNSTDK